MSGKVVGWAFSKECPSVASKLILVKLADNSNEEGLCWPSVRLIVKHTGLTDRAVRQNLHLLEEKGLIQISARISDNGRQSSNFYKLCIAETETKTTHSTEQDAGGRNAQEYPHPRIYKGGTPSRSADRPRTTSKNHHKTPPTYTLIGGDDSMRLRIEAFRRMLHTAVFDAWFGGATIHAEDPQKPIRFVLNNKYSAHEAANRYKYKMDPLFGDDCEITFEPASKPSEDQT